MRSLTVEEINVLKCNGCFAEDWADITVDEDFSPEYIHNVAFYGEIDSKQVLHNNPFLFLLELWLLFGSQTL